MTNKGRVVIVIMSVITTLSVGACLPTINNKSASRVCEALEEKYGEEFVVTHIGDRLNTSTTKVYVYPKNEADVVFTAEIDESGDVEDDYVSNILMNDLEKNIVRDLEQKGFVCDATATITENDILEEDKNININEFVKKNGIEAVLICIIFDEQEKDSELLLSALEELSYQYEFNLVIYGYCFSHENYLKCDADFRRYPFVGITQIESYSPTNSFKTVISAGDSSISVNELRRLLEGK